MSRVIKQYVAVDAHLHQMAAFCLELFIGMMIGDLRLTAY